MSTSSELAAVETLLMHVLPDPLGFAERVLGELAQRLGTNPAATDPAATDPAATDPASEGPDVVPGDVSAAHEVLVDRNVLLAAALGACECWGEDPGCPGCLGAGSAGWVPPDPELYAAYVAPAAVRSSWAGQRAEPAEHIARSDRRAPRVHAASRAATSLAHEEPDEGEAT